MSKKPLVLMILDGWGIREYSDDNAIALANPNNFNSLWDKYPHTKLRCSGVDVGLPPGQMGNSEVGHLNMGSGRVVYQEISRISRAIEDRTFFSNEVFLNAIREANKIDGAVHLMGLLSDGGVHSHMEHLFALLELCKVQNVKKLFIHAFLDGRDVAPQSAGQFIQALEARMKELELGSIATIGGRFYGMDRDNRWERIERAYDAIVLGQGLKAANAQAALSNSYENRIKDEFVEPVVIVDDVGQPIAKINDGDSVIFFNFRADRARQISRAFTEPKLSRMNREFLPKIQYVCMTQYDENIMAPVAFNPQNLENTLGEIFAYRQMKQLRIAETEKYAHVTFFFNGGIEEPNEGEDRILIPSPQVETYNLMPEMSAEKVTDRVIEEINRDYYDVIIINYANPDMVGHTGVLKAAVQAIQTVDACLDKVVKTVLKKEGTVIITADHGNCEMMVDPVNLGPFTAHTLSLVPFILVSKQFLNRNLKENLALCDIAPTILEILNIEAPAEMTGQSLIEKN